MAYRTAVESAENYAKAQTFLRKLRGMALRKTIPRDTLLTLRGQALAGDVEGAEKGLWKIVMRESDGH